MKTNRLPRAGYVDQVGRKMTDRIVRGDQAWQTVVPKTDTARFAKKLVSHEFGQGNQTAYGSIDGKAMTELVKLGISEGLIRLNAQGKPAKVERFLDELRPFQLEFTKEGADEIRLLIAQASSRREFFEVSAKWPGGEWSEGKANQILKGALQSEPPPGQLGSITIQVVGEGQDATIQTVGGEGQDGGALW